MRFRLLLLLPVAFLWRAGYIVAHKSLIKVQQGYLDKHAAEIIDYQRRQQVGKPIGSG